MLISSQPRHSFRDDPSGYKFREVLAVPRTPTAFPEGHGMIPALDMSWEV
jgi:hypothetical protein